MSSTASTFQTMIQDFINGIATVLDQIAQALTSYAPVIAAVLVSVAIGVVGFRLLSRIPFVNRIVGWLTGAF